MTSRSDAHAIRSAERPNQDVINVQIDLSQTINLVAIENKRDHRLMLNLSEYQDSMQNMADAYLLGV